MVAAFPSPPSRSVALDRDERFVLEDVPWGMYVAMRDALDRPGLRMTYCEGRLELVRPSRDHEEVKAKIGRFVELFAYERRIRLYGYGSTTFRAEAKERGLEPDECYCVGGPLRDVPDVAIEVALTSGGVNKLDVYRGLAVPEVWFWHEHAFHLFALRENGYVPITRSESLPELDFQVLARCVAISDQHEALEAFAAYVKAMPGA